MKTEIISIGTELLLGEITDTNSAYLASQLPLLGLDLHFISTVGDNQPRLVDTLRHAWQRSDVIITTGGLGPTQDDITREAIAQFLGEEITIDPELVKQFEELFNRYKLDMPLSNIRQAGVIPSAKVLYNSRGTAPGWWIERDGRIIVTMPGPPGEMQLMWTMEVFPSLQRKIQGAIIVSRTVKTFGLSEARVDELVSSYLTATNPTLATYAKADGIHLRITAKAGEESKAQELLGRREADVKDILGSCVWGVDSDTLEGIVGKALVTQGLTLATMEFGTGGFLANTITNVAESHRFYKGGIVAWAEDVRTAFGIDERLVSRCGIVSPEMAEAMATIAREKLGANIGVGITVVVGPDEMDGKSVGTVIIGINDGSICRTFIRNHPGARLRVKQRAVTSALFELGKTLNRGGTHAPDY